MDTRTSKLLDRRQWLARSGGGLGAAALASLLNPDVLGTTTTNQQRAKRVVFLCQSGAPSQIDLFDPKPLVKARHGQELPESIRMGQRLTTMTSSQDELPLTASPYSFHKYGESGAELSELLPFTAKVADDLCIVRSLHTEAINHDPAITLLQTGSQQPGRPSMGSWLSYGLGGENENLPTFVVFLSGGQSGDQPLFGRLWGSGFLPPQHQGVKFRTAGDPVLYLSDPPGISRSMRRRMIAAQAQLNQLQYKQVGDPKINARIAQFERAFRMQISVPEITDISDETEQTLELYGPDVRQPGTYAANCLMARRLVERGTRFVQLYHRGWDHHKNIRRRLPEKCRQTDQPSAALVQDLKQRGLLEDTLVIWAGEFGRTVYCQGKLSDTDYGRDHHPRCFSIWMAGGRTRAGITYGKTDEYSYNIVENPVHIHDLHATILHCLGIDHEQLTYRHQGRDYRLTDIAGTVVHDILT